MTFQGDVRGIGLAELLQGLARGRKEGVLTLTAGVSQRATLGLMGGKLYLLAEPEEDPEIWRNFVRDAWAGHENFRVDDLRMSEVARAHRMERLFGLLDCDGMHFRFEPGPLPGHQSESGEPAIGMAENRSHSVQCEGSAVEYILLEYARLADELESVQDQVAFLVEDVVPYVIAAGKAKSPPRFREAIDGKSTLLEISDRLGWPLRQTRLSLWNDLTADAVRIAHPDEMLDLGLTELHEKRFSRAAQRLSAWCREGRPGPVTPAEAEALATEWIAGRLPAALVGMPGTRVRTLLRRLDHTLQNTTASVLHWEEALRLDPTSRLTRMHWMAAQFADDAAPDQPDIRDLLDLARKFSEAHHPRRSGPVLVIAAHSQPTATAQQIELGQGLVAAGRVEEGAPWVMAAASTLLNQGHADRVIAPLRQVIEADPTNRECRRLLSLARRSSTTVRKLRKKLLITLAIAGLGAGAAVVKVRGDQDFEKRLGEVRALIDNPLIAQQQLDATLADEYDAPRVRALRDAIIGRQTEHEAAKRSEWNNIYREAHTQATGDDPILGLRLSLDLPDHPRLKLIEESWPEEGDLFEAVAQSLTDRIGLLGAASPDEAEQIAAETQIRATMGDMREMVEGVDMSVGIGKLLEGLEQVVSLLNGRDAEREQILAERLDDEAEQYQLQLLSEAREHGADGEFERSLRKYQELTASDSSGRIGTAIAEEMADVERQRDAVVEARALSRKGQHEEAWKVLQENVNKPGTFVMPWHVDTFPSGAQVEIRGRQACVTPFDIETTFDDATHMRFTLAGFDVVELDVAHPADQMLFLSRTPLLSWRGVGRIDALPNFLGSDALFVDRKGNIARINAAGEELWRNRIKTVSGIARTPVRLPGRPDSFLLVTEDGKAQAWIIDGKDGSTNGPFKLESEVVAGPYPTENNVAVRLKNGNLATFVDRLRPTILSPKESLANADLDDRYRYGDDQGMRVLRRRSDLVHRLPSPWNDWIIEAQDDVFRVFRESDSQGDYTVTLEGQWEYMAWEAPHGEFDQGRLWISDGTRLRAFVP